jgi:hypothetical protein
MYALTLWRRIDSNRVTKMVCESEKWMEDGITSISGEWVQVTDDTERSKIPCTDERHTLHIHSEYDDVAREPTNR